MNKKVLILSGSPRKNGNSDILCNEFARGAIEAGHDVEKIRVSEKTLATAVVAMPVVIQAFVPSRTIWQRFFKR